MLAARISARKLLPVAPVSANDLLNNATFLPLFCGDRPALENPLGESFLGEISRLQNLLTGQLLVPYWEQKKITRLLNFAQIVN